MKCDCIMMIDLCFEDKIIRFMDLIEGKMKYQKLIEIAHRNCQGERIGIISLDALHPIVVEAYLLSALEDGFPAVIEVGAHSFSDNRTTPSAFTNNINQIAEKVEFPLDQLIFSAYDLNLLVQMDTADQNEQKKISHIISEIIEGGFGIFGLNASGANFGELIRTIEKSVSENLGAHKPLYVIDLPGAQADPGRGSFSDPAENDAKIPHLIEEMLVDCEPNIKERILAVRMSLGRGHDGETVFPFSKHVFSDIHARLKAVFPNLLGAGHIDHQPQSILSELVKAHFGYMRVGSELTYTMREAIFSLAMMENESMQGKPGVYLSNLMVELDKAMQFSPDRWSAYYPGNGFEQLLARKYSLYDRSRFFWDDEEVQEAWARLVQNFKSYPVPVTVLRQFMPDQYAHLVSGEIQNTPETLVLDKLQDILRRYSTACGWRGVE
jgi:D-tagatose-1,6-bisphosphate aldolase subunit GatZ/KbaZ